jgi:hypothetical protein
MNILPSTFAQMQLNQSVQNNRIVLSAIAILAGVLYVGVCISHEYWRDELHAWRLVMSSESWSQLWYNRRHDGHPMAWFSVLYLLKQLGGTAEHIRWVNLVFSFSAAVLLLYYAQFSLWQKVMSIFTYWHLYEYTAFARNYAIGVFFAFLFCTLYPYRNKNWGALSIFFSWCALMQCSVASLILGTSMAGIWLWDMYHETNKRTAIAWSLACLGVLVLTMADVFLPNLGFSYTRNVFAGRGLLFKAQGIWLIALIGLIASLTWYGGRAVKKHFAEHTEMTSFLVTAIVLPLFFILIYPGVTRHFGHIFIALEVFFWLLLVRNVANAVVKKQMERLLFVSSCCFVIWGPYAAWLDSKHTYSTLELAAKSIRSHAQKSNIQTDQYCITGHPEYLVDAMTDLCAQDKFYSFGMQQYAQAVSWNHVFSNRVPTATELQTLCAKEQKAVFFITNSDTCHWMQPYTVNQFDAELRPDESIKVYFFKVPEE